MSDSMQSWIQEYINAQKAALDTISVEGVAQAIATLAEAHRSGRRIFIFGNGGSASNASHFVTDLGKGSSDKLTKRFKVLSLNDNVSWMTAIGNDYSYEDVYLRQLQNYAEPGDVVLTLSVSGSSPNLVKAFEWANSQGLTTIAMVGGKKGKLAAIAKQTLVIGSEHYGRAEDAQMTICHLLCYAFMERPEVAG